MPRPLLASLLLLGLGLVLVTSTVPGPFTVDEANYLVTVTALRQGSVAVPGTEGLSPSRELYWFDPQGPSRVARHPVTSVAPPLYAPLAWPFAWFGWRGLAALNVLAYLGIAGLVFTYARRHSTDPAVPWLAAAAFALGGYALEYAQALWPHMLAALLCTAAWVLSDRLRDGAGPRVAVAAGILAGLAAGVRYQNVFLAACIGLGILIWAPRRIRAAAAYGAGCAIPLALSGWINFLRMGSWNPISKGPGYLAVGDGPVAGNRWADALVMAWSRMVDFSARPPLTGTEHMTYLRQAEPSGAFLIGSVMKKAWLQSAPWIGLALLVLAWAWWRRGRPAADPAVGGRRRELKALSLVVFPTLALFALAGVYRTDGLGFNQRYFIELVPLVAVAFAWALGGLPWSRRLVLAAALAGCVAVAWPLLLASSPVVHQYLLLYLPLALAAALVAAWLLRRRHPRALAAVAVACLAWATCLHLAQDWVASRQMRSRNHQVAEQLDRALPPRAALFTWWGSKDPAAALLLDRDLVVLDLRNDDGESAARMIRDFDDQGRRSFLFSRGLPRDVAARLAGVVAVRPAGMAGPTPLLELTSNLPPPSH